MIAPSPRGLSTTVKSRSQSRPLSAFSSWKSELIRRVAASRGEGLSRKVGWTLSQYCSMVEV